MSYRPLSTAAGSIVAASLLVATTLQPFVSAQRRKTLADRDRYFHASVHGDLKETYISDRHVNDQNDHSEQELTIKYDVDKDLRYDGQELVELPGRKANAGGSFHARVDTQTSDRTLHEHYQMDTAGSIPTGNIDIEGLDDQRIDVSNDDGVPQNCKSEGNITKANDDCGVVVLSDIGFHDYDKGKVVTLEHSVYPRPSSERPSDLTPEFDYVAKEWYSAVAQGTIGSTFTITIAAKKSLAPPVTDDGYKVTREKTLQLSIKMSPSGTTADDRKVLIGNDVAAADLSVFLDPKTLRLVPAGRSDR